ncbi:MAG: Acetyltransferase component of pyruvate dehydrogenase complex [Candidatus Gallionella acididurans]|uniref:Acetyltransferase component of pyruvate dehydrogenase complex n=1 Tax=Candidatus Gallionella acididurans TaxID=1796491 RepID=A0A139BT44_9PROT|nr:MAG: Acetyltransferase component of pyruvate dehydrogenase complex [Candidatus Gallionella acididurans]
MAEIKQVLVPDIGDYKDVSIIELLVKAGDTIKAEDNLVTLETDKAAMDVPSPYSGVIRELKVKVGDKVSQGSLILLLESSEAAAAPKDNPAAAQVMAAPVAAKLAEKPAAAPLPAQTMQAVAANGKAHASPAIRRFARELGVPVAQVKGSGEKGRVTKDDVQNFVKAALAQPRAAAGGNGMQVAAMPVVDFAKFGAIETRPLSRIKKISGANLHRNWVSIPHVTQFDEADITEMEAFRKELGVEYAKQNIKITPLAFLVKAVVVALQQFPEFNASLDAGGENLVLKQYFHIGVAVDTPDGLMVPVLRDADKKGIVQLARELGEMSARAREKKITAAEMQGGCFSISSLGGIGGTAFTPIINAPELAILGVSRAVIKPMHQDDTFVARLMLPLSLSYDHRVIDGAAAARFIVFLSQVLADTRRLAL